MRNQLLADACFSLVSANELLCSGTYCITSHRCLRMQPEIHGNLEMQNDKAWKAGSINIPVSL